jgi:hypothetical protein
LIPCGRKPAGFFVKPQGGRAAGQPDRRPHAEVEFVTLRHFCRLVVAWLLDPCYQGVRGNGASINDYIRNQTMKYSYTEIESLESHRKDSIEDYDLQIAMMKHALDNGFNLEWSGKRMLRETIRARLASLKAARGRLDQLIEEANDIDLD